MKSEKLIEEKKKVFEEIASLKQLVTSEKELRDKANEQVKELKQKRIAAFDEINKMKKELNEILGIVESLSQSMGGSYRMLKAELKDLEWDYQTGVYSIKREKEMVKNIEALEEELARSEILYEKRNRLNALQTKLKDFYTEANIYHNLLINRAKDSEGHHDTMMKGIKKLEALEKKIQKLGEDIQKESAPKQSRQKHRPLEVSDELREKAETILGNFKKGKKVTTEELSLLQSLGLY